MAKTKKDTADKGAVPVNTAKPLKKKTDENLIKNMEKAYACKHAIALKGRKSADVKEKKKEEKGKE